MFQDTQQQVNPNKLFVGNLPWGTTEEDLRQIFSQFGELVEENGIRLITDRMTGRSKGIAFVEFKDAKSADDAIAGTQGLELEGRIINVSIARPPQPREDRGGFGGDRRGGGSRGGFGGGDRRGGGGGYNNNRGGSDRYSRDDRRAA